MKLQIRKLKFFLNENSNYQYLKALYKTFITSRNFKILSHKIKIKILGGFRININFLKKEELNSLYYDLDYIHGLRYFIETKPVFFIYSANSKLIYNFISKTLNCKTIVYKDNFFQNYNKNKNLKVVSENIFLNEIEKNKKNKNNILISEKNVSLSNKISHKNFNFIFSQNENKYLNKNFNLYFYDQYGKINLNSRNKFNKFYLYSREILIPKKRKKNLISGVACLKNLDLYPFDICFESALMVLDELIIGIDKQTFNKRYSKLLNKFLNQTKYRKKIKIEFLNFNSSTTNNCSTRGRWIADVFNYLSGKCINENIMLCGADELFDINLKKTINKNILNSYDELKLKFVHFVFNFNSIRDPKFTSYNSWHRIVKAEKYVSNHDGMGFRKYDNFYPLKKKINCTVFHIGYVINYQKKIKMHMDKKNGVFGNLYSTKKYISLIKPIPVDLDIKTKLIKTLNKFNYMNGYKVLKKLI